MVWKKKKSEIVHSHILVVNALMQFWNKKLGEENSKGQ